MMSYLSVLLSSPLRSLVNPFAARKEVEANIVAAQERSTAAEDGPEDSALPSGIASMEHWLDLNA